MNKPYRPNSRKLIQLLVVGIIATAAMLLINVNLALLGAPVTEFAFLFAWLVYSLTLEICLRVRFVHEFMRIDEGGKKAA